MTGALQALWGYRLPLSLKITGCLGGSEGLASASEPEWSLALAVPGVRGSSDLPTALASGRGLRSQREERLLTSPLLKGRPSLLLRYHRVRSSHSHRVMASNARSRRREASSVRRPSQGEQFGTCNWDTRAHVPPEVIHPRIGRHEDCRERQPCQCRHGYGPYANAHRVCHGSREAASARPAPLASVLLFLDTGCQGGLIKEHVFPAVRAFLPLC